MSGQANGLAPEHRASSVKCKTSDQINFKAINQVALGMLPKLLPRWLPDGKRVGDEWVAKNPRRSDQHAGSFKINLRTSLWCDFATGDRGGDVTSLAAYLANVSQFQAARALAAMVGKGSTFHGY